MTMPVSVGNILDIPRGLIIQQVNAQGVMGSGIAKAIRDKWPIVFDEYSEIIKPHPADVESKARLGHVIITPVEEDLAVASIVGQQFYGKYGALHTPRYTSYDALDIAFTKIARCLQGIDMPVHYPLIGSDRGGAHWPIVKSIINYRLRGIDHRLWLLPGVVEPTSSVNTEY